MTEDVRSRMAADGAEAVHSVEVPRWGTIHVRDVSVAESDRWSAKAREIGNISDIDPTAFAAAVVICDEAGNRIFDPLNEDDIAFLGKRRKRDLSIVLSAAGADSGN